VSLVFLDTNILIYRLDPLDPDKRIRAREWIALLGRTRRGRLSWQVLTEYNAAVTRKLLAHGYSTHNLRLDIRSYSAWQPLAPDLALFEAAWSLQDRYGFSWWDAQIVAAALRQECTLLLSEDLQHNLVVDNRLTIINPFAPDAPPPPAVP
jgi:predicted nucleic acid-binding protein